MQRFSNFDFFIELYNAGTSILLVGGQIFQMFDYIKIMINFYISINATKSVPTLDLSWCPKFENLK